MAPGHSGMGHWEMTKSEHENTLYGSATLTNSLYIIV